MSTDAHGNFSGKRLVVFGCGYVGAVVAQQALARRMRVTALTRNATNAVLLREQGIETVVADLAGDAWHGQIEGGADFVLNCVSSGGVGLAGYRRSYVDGMRSIVTWAQQRGGAGTMVFTSSTAVYPQDRGATIDETAPTAGASERGRLLLEAETCLRAATGACRRWFVLRLAGIYGPARHHIIEQVHEGHISGTGANHLNLAHRDDIASAIWACFAAPPEVANEIFNVADDAPAPKAEVVAWLTAQLRVPAPTFTGEPAAGRAALTPDRLVSNAKLKTRLGWRPGYPTFREGYASLLSR